MSERDGRHAAAAGHEDAVLTTACRRFSQCITPSAGRLDRRAALPARRRAEDRRSAWRSICCRRIAAARAAGGSADRRRSKASGAASAAACSRMRELCPICSASAARSLRCCAWSNRPRTSWRSSNRAAIAARYFVLMGHLSPLDGIGPEQLGFARARSAARRRRGAGSDPRDELRPSKARRPRISSRELAHRDKVHQASRIAHGVPVGGELEYVDGGTLAHALAGRHALSG